MIDLCCILIILVSVSLLLVLIYGDSYKQKILKNKKMWGSLLIVLVLPLFLLITVTALSKDNTSYDTSNLTMNSKQKEIKKVGINKIIIVGDSRMEFIERDKDKLDIPNNFIFDAKSGAEIDWTVDEAIPKLEELLQENKKYNVHVIFNMGVNDLNYIVDVKQKGVEYFELYESLIKKYKNVSFYILSVNPIDEDVIDDYFNNKRTNKKIETFNNTFITLLNDTGFDNATYCDSYHNLSFNLPDGLHYDTKTDQKIIDYIKDDCVVLK